MKTLLIIPLFIATLLFSPADGISAADAAPSWKAGVARANITPDEFMWMSGYGARDHVAEGKQTDLWAKVLVLEDSSHTRVVLVTLDLVGLDRATELAVRSEIEHQHHIPLANIALNCSHTHSGPVVGRNLASMYFLNEAQAQQVVDYTRTLENKILAAVSDAISSLAPADVSFGSGTSDFAVNRRNNLEEKVPELKAAGTLQGPIDHSVPVLRIHREQKLACIVFGYACHATVLSFYEWSGDYPGYAQIALEASHPGCQAMFWAGCGADQNPLPRRSVELARKYGNQLADSVEKVLTTDLTPIHGSITTTYAEIPLHFSHVPSRKELEEQLMSQDRYIVSRAKHVLQQLSAQGSIPETYPFPIQSWKLGDGPLWFFLGGEVVVDFPLRIKRELPDHPLWIAGYSNDVMAYIPSLRVLREGRYEGGGAMVYYGLPSPWAESVEEDIMATVHQQAKSLLAK